MNQRDGEHDNPTYQNHKDSELVDHDGNVFHKMQMTTNHAYTIKVSSELSTPTEVIIHTYGSKINRTCSYSTPRCFTSILGSVVEVT
jgi:hypothetical protein